ncbi:allantoinase AllB [Peptoniphilus sp. AGMB00490]|uniref:allantoinase n=1 Tax=Peptoniphilus faecalis TaxID=2731255 RepID=A0A848REM6_9FIRM|nr:allantoinase AllB [Peptoniphilus faecalis]NMW84181.1 allantoinase AllB [Peptoniphilus faecalis]
MKLDLAIINGIVYVDGNFREVDIGIKDEKFAVICEKGLLPEAEKTIDATGKYVIPGGIDTHVHFRDPGHTDRGTFYTESQAAVAGGTTTILEHPISSPPQYNKEILDNRKKVAKERQGVVDYAFYAAAGGQYPEEITKVAKEGIVAFKTFLHEAPEGRDDEFIGLTMANDYEVYIGMKEVAKTGLLLASHAENNDLIQGFIDHYRKEGKVTPEYHCLSRPPISEYSTVQKMLLFAKETGCRLELVHISTPEAMEMAKQAKLEGQEVFLETCPHYLLLTEEELLKHGPFAKCNPPLRSQETVDKIWDYVIDGTVDFIGSDHGPFLIEEKENGNKDIFVAPAGFIGIDLRLPLMLNEVAKGKRGLTLEKVVELCSTNPAKIFDIYPKKGTIQPGSDGDLVIFDMNDKFTVDRNKNYSGSKEIARVYDGKELHCKLNYTILRGKVVMEDGLVDPEKDGTKGWGELVLRNEK